MTFGAIPSGPPVAELAASTAREREACQEESSRPVRLSVFAVARSGDCDVVASFDLRNHCALVERGSFHARGVSQHQRDLDLRGVP